MKLSILSTCILFAFSPSVFAVQDKNTDLDMPKLSLLKKGSKGRQVEELREILSSRGFLSQSEKADGFDSTLLSAVEAAQEEYGLVKDGIADQQLYENLRLGANTRSVMYEKRKSEIADIIATAKAEGFDKVVVVNVPSFTLRLLDTNTGKLMLESPVIIGKPSSQTPIFRTNIVAVKYNPTWTPPPSAMKKNILPHLGNEEKVGWIVKHKLVIRDKAGNVVAPEDITASEFRSGGYSIMQPAGDDNALGVLKFETDNNQNIYLHDTNQRSLFSKANRAQSMGCIRVKEWMSLAEIMLGKPSSEIEKSLDTKRTFMEKVGKTPVFVTYSLADEVSGKWVVFPDVYARGQRDSEILFSKKADEKVVR